MIFWIIVLYLLYSWLCPKKTPHVLNVYFGVPGSGKTTFLCYILQILLDICPEKCPRGG